MNITGCKAGGCDSKHYAHGYCNIHYGRMKRHGTTERLTENHGMEKSIEYRVWQNMKKRCYNELNTRYNYYGARGIKVCDRWLHSFKNFYSDMGEKPSDKAQIDRINNDGDYEPGNCRWVSPAENSRKRSTSKLSMGKARDIRAYYFSGARTQKQLAVMFKVAQTTISRVIKNNIWREC